MLDGCVATPVTLSLAILFVARKAKTKEECEDLRLNLEIMEGL